MTNTETFASVPATNTLGAIYGLAYGDAIGDPTEFAKYPALKGKVGVPARLRITDDTQMSLAVWAALDAWDPASGLGMLRLELVASFTAWYNDPDNNREPGGACIAATRKLDERGMGYWLQATGPSSAGCGSVMRAPWIGLHPKVTDETLEAIAGMQAVLTHAPAENVWVSAAAAALTRALARGEVEPGSAAEWVRLWAEAREGVAEYDEVALGQVARVARDTIHGQPGRRYLSYDEYTDEGLAHVSWAAGAAAKLASALQDDPWGFDPCTIAGEGWRCREAFAVALGILDGFADSDATAVLVRAAETNGDSDSIGAIAGALFGAARGADAFPAEWEFRLESRYRNELGAIAARLKG